MIGDLYYLPGAELWGVEVAEPPGSSGCTSENHVWAVWCRSEDEALCAVSSGSTIAEGGNLQVTGRDRVALMSAVSFGTGPAGCFASFIRRTS
jgi:hypothetical protein